MKKIGTHRRRSSGSYPSINSDNVLHVLLSALSLPPLLFFVSLSRFTALVALISSPRTPHAQAETHRAILHELCFETGTPESERVTAVQTWRMASRYFAQPTHIYIYTHTRARERRVTEETTYTDLAMTIRNNAQNRYTSRKYNVYANVPIAR